MNMPRIIVKDEVVHSLTAQKLLDQKKLLCMETNSLLNER